MASGSTVIEHVVLFKIREGARHDKIKAWLSALNGLNSLDCVLYLCAAPSRTDNCHFTHALYAQYKNREALATYSAHPRHVTVVEEYGAPIVEDLVALDWEAEAPSQHQPGFESSEALRIALLKPRNDLGEAHRAKLEEKVLGEYGKGLASIARVSFGENISPGRAKGFSWGLVCMFKTEKDLEDLNHNEEVLRLLREEVISEIEESVVMECCIRPLSQT